MNRDSDARDPDDRDSDGREEASADVLALRQIIDEARAATPAEPNWERVEAELMAKISLEQTAEQRHRPKRSAWGSLMVFAAAAAALVMVLANQGQEPSALQSAEAPTLVDVSTLPAQERDGELPTYMVAAMKPKSIVASGDEPMRFGLPGVATWVLAPHSRVIIDTVAMPHQLTLEKGAVHAEVVPRRSSNEIIESFAVVAGTTRVAVHGTVFSVTRSVTRSGEQVTVEVTRGAVTVGPAGHRGLTTGRLLVSPARAAFSLHGGELAKTLSPSAPVAVAEAEPAAPAEAGVDARADAADTGQPDGAPRTAKRNNSGETANDASNAEPAEPPAQPPLTADEARALVAACLSSRAKRTSSSDDRLVTISSQVSVKADANGNVHTVRFNPPVKPSLGSSCGGVLFGRTTAGNGDLSFRVLVAK